MNHKRKQKGCFRKFVHIKGLYLKDIGGEAIPNQLGQTL